MYNVFTGWAILILLIATNSRAANSPSPDGPPIPPEYTYVDHKGYQYSYKTTVGGWDKSWIGTVEVKAPKTNEVVFKQTNLKPGGCSVKELAKPHTLRHGPEHREIVALCGEDEGHFATLMLFESGNLLASLDYVITEPNLVWHPEYQSYLAEIVFRDERMDVSEGMDYLSMVYEWSLDTENAINGFHPIFNSHSYKQYLYDYKWHKRNHAEGDPRYLPMIAALVATSKASLICTELNSPPLNKLALERIKQYLSVAETLGYPTFDLSICKRGREK